MQTSTGINKIDDPVKENIQKAQSVDKQQPGSVVITEDKASDKSQSISVPQISNNTKSAVEKVDQQSKSDSDVEVIPTTKSNSRIMSLTNLGKNKPGNSEAGKSTYLNLNQSDFNTSSTSSTKSKGFSTFSVNKQINISNALPSKPVNPFTKTASIKANDKPTVEKKYPTTTSNTPVLRANASNKFNPKAHEEQPKDNTIKIVIDESQRKKRLLSKDTTTVDSTKTKLSKKSQVIYDLMGELLREVDSTPQMGTGVSELRMAKIENQLKTLSSGLTFIGGDYVGKNYCDHQYELLKTGIYEVLQSFGKSISDMNKSVVKLSTQQAQTTSDSAIPTGKISPEEKAILNDGTLNKNIEELTTQVNILIKDCEKFRAYMSSNDALTQTKNSYYEGKINDTRIKIEKFCVDLKANLLGIFKNFNTNFSEEIEAIKKAKVNQSEFDDKMSTLSSSNIEMTQSLQKFIKSSLDSSEKYEKKMEEKLTATTKFYQNKMSNLESQIESLKSKDSFKYKQLPFKSVLFLKNYTKKFENEANADILFKPIIDYCLTYGIFLKYEIIDKENYLLTAKYEKKVIFQLPFVFKNLTLKCEPIIGYTLWEVPAVLSVEYRTNLLYNYVTTYSSDVIFAVFLERDLEETKRIERCIKLLQKMGLFSYSVITDDRVIKGLIAKLDKDDDMNQIKVSKTVLYRKPKLIKKIFSSVDEKYMMDLESRNRVVLECVKFHRSAVRYDSLDDYEKNEPPKAIPGKDDEMTSYKLWTMFPKYASELTKAE